MQNTTDEMIELTLATSNASPELSTTGGHTRPPASPPMSVPTATASPTNDGEKNSEDTQLFEKLIGSPTVLEKGAGIRALEACIQKGKFQSPLVIPSTAAECPSPVSFGNASNHGFFPLAHPVAQRASVTVTGFAAPPRK